MKIITVVIKSEHDVVLARQRAKRISSLAGLSVTDQTRFVTGVSEIARNAIMYGNGGKVEFSAIQKNAEKFIEAAIIDNSDKDLRELVSNSIKSKHGMGIGISGTKNLVDYFTIETRAGGGNKVILWKRIPEALQSVSTEVIAEWSRQLTEETPKSFLEEIQQQNQLLVQTLEKLEEREKDLENQLEETIRLNKELEISNNELKDFAYVVSHDLKAPLRAISSLAGWIAGDYKDKLDDEGNKMIDMLLGRILRMNNLIDGILQYSRVGRVKEEKVLVDLNTVVDDSIVMINPPENIEINVENQLPKIYFEETRINQVFQNLIGNAIKYMDKEKGLVKIGSIETEKAWQFYISDNGPGIEEKYFEKIFKIFQTLNSRDKVEGTGIGLTIVKKIIDQYHGKIWVDSVVNEGTVFSFTIPKEADNKAKVTGE